MNTIRYSCNLCGIGYSRHGAIPYDAKDMYWHLREEHNIKHDEARKRVRHCRVSLDAFLANKRRIENGTWKPDETPRPPNIGDWPAYVGQNVNVTFFDSFSLKNRTEVGQVKHIGADGLLLVEVTKPIRKRVTVAASDCTQYVNPIIEAQQHEAQLREMKAAGTRLVTGRRKRSGQRPRLTR